VPRGTQPERNTDKMLITPKELFAHCLSEGYMAGAFNVFNLDSLFAVLEAAKRENSPVIVQLSGGSKKYSADPCFLTETIISAAGRCEIPVMFQHDHCMSLAECRRMISWGIPSVMYDGSHLSLEENKANTAELVEYAHSKGVWVEAEIGRLPGFEDEVFSDENLFTDPETAAAFVAATGCDSLAVAVGTSHGGILSDTSLPFQRERLKAIQKVLPAYPLVLHGGASLDKVLIDGVNAQGAAVPYMRNVSEPDIASCKGLGVVKVNMDVDNFMVFTTAVRKSITQQPDKYDPRIYLGQGWEAFGAQVRHKMRNVLGSSGRADSI